MADQDETYKRNLLVAKPRSVMQGYQTTLDPLSEMAFQQWVQKNNVPFDPSSSADYDMRGYFKALQSGQTGNSSVNANDGQLHYPDTFKTPYHESFSNESRYAEKSAPSWNVFDQLQEKNGHVVYDEKKANLLRNLLRGEASVNSLGFGQ